jgi:hypothetical protein
VLKWNRLTVRHVQWLLSGISISQKSPSVAQLCSNIMGLGRPPQTPGIQDVVFDPRAGTFLPSDRRLPVTRVAYNTEVIGINLLPEAGREP